MDASFLSASDARAKIVEMADNYSWETVCREIVLRMNGDEAREFVEHFDSVLNN